MATLDVYNMQREKVGQVEVSDAVFGAELKEHLYYDVIKMQLAARRAGTASSKTRSEVSGGGRKPWRQKGTGRARSGTSRSPVWTGGGTIFGPKPRQYGHKVNKKVRRAAMCTALTQKNNESQLVILDKIELDGIKTRAVAGFLKGFDVSSVLIIDDGNTNLQLSARNIPQVKVLRPDGLNLYDILYHRNLFITQGCLENIQRRLQA